MSTVEFNNHEINIESLAQFQNCQFKKIAKEKLKVLYLSLIIFYSIVSVLILSIHLIFDKIKLNNLLIFSTLVCLMTLHYFYTFHAFHGIFYALREKDIIYKRGVFTKSTTIIPFNRVQNIAIHQGILSRWFGLADLELFTSGINDLNIKGLYFEDAMKLKEFIANTITEEKELKEEDLKSEEVL